MNEESREYLLIHIEGLQATLTKRNARIADLEKQLQSLETKIAQNNKVRKLVNQAYKDGWKDCASKLMEITRETALQLRAVRKSAFSIYLDGDKIEHQ